MNTDIIKGRWDEIKGKIKQQWSKLTDEDVTKMKGSYEELHGTLQSKYGYEKDKGKEEIDKFLKKHGYDK